MLLDQGAFLRLLLFSTHISDCIIILLLCLIYYYLSFYFTFHKDKALKRFMCVWWVWVSPKSLESSAYLTKLTSPFPHIPCTIHIQSVNKHVDLASQICFWHIIVPQWVNILFYLIIFIILLLCILGLGEYFINCLILQSELIVE